MDVFAFNLFLSASKGSGNVFLSPFSIAAAFSLLHPAAIGECAAELNALVGVTSPAEGLQYWQGLIQQFQEAETAPVKFLLANGVWATERSALQAQYQKAVESLSSAVKLSNFAKDHEQITIEINKWVEGRTNDRIKDLIPTGVLDANTVAVLVNALFFHAKWDHKFSSQLTKPGKFFVTPDNTVDVSMMFMKSHLDYATSEKADYVRLWYQGKRFAMELVVPKEVDGVTAVLSELNPEFLEALRSKAAPTDMQLFLPKFKVEAGGDITDLLRRNGLEASFGKNPQFPNMFENSEQIYVSNCFHKVFMEVDEEGTEAAAATALIMKRCMIAVRENPVPIVRVDRPSIVLLSDFKTKQALFFGLLRDPTK